MMKSLLTIFIFCVVILNFPKPCSAQTIFKEIQVGDKCPDVLLENIENYRATTARLSDFKDKLLIIDFWSRGCSSCIGSFPKIDFLQKKFKDNIQILLVSKESKMALDKYIASVNKAIKLPDIPRITNDKIISKLFPYRVVPYHIWINADGIVIAKTTGGNLTEDHILDVLAKKKVIMSQPFHERYEEYSKIPLRDLIATDKNKLLLYNSIFSKFSFNYPNFTAQNIDTVNNTTRRSFVNVSIVQLYLSAFNDSSNAIEANQRIILDVRNKSRLIYPGKNKGDEWKLNSCFSYEQIMPIFLGSKSNLFMQEDLNRYFGALLGIKGKAEKRKVKTLTLVRTSTEDKLSTKGGIPNNELPTFINGTLQFAFIEQLRKIYLNQGYLIIDKTNYWGNIDIHLSGNLSDVEILRKELEKYDLNILEKEEELEVLTISEINEPNN